MAHTRLTTRKRTSSSLVALGCLAPRRNREEDVPETVPEPPQEMPQEENQEEFKLEEIPLEDPIELDPKEYMPEDSAE